MFATCALSDSQVLRVAMCLFSGLAIYCVKQWPRDPLYNTASRYPLGSKPRSNMFLFSRKDFSNIASLRDLFLLHLNQISFLRMLQAKAKSLKLGLQWKLQLDDCRTDTKYFQISLEALSGGEHCAERQHTGRHKQVFTLHPRGFKSTPCH